MWYYYYRLRMENFDSGQWGFIVIWVINYDKWLQKMYLMLCMIYGYYIVIMKCMLILLNFVFDFNCCV